MNLLDRYITRELVMPFLFGICIFTSLFMSTELLHSTRLQYREQTQVCAQ